MASYSDGFTFNKLTFRNGSNSPRNNKGFGGGWLLVAMAPPRHLRVQHRPISVNETSARTPAAPVGRAGAGALSLLSWAATGETLLAASGSTPSMSSGSQRLYRRLDLADAVVERAREVPAVNL